MKNEFNSSINISYVILISRFLTYYDNSCDISNITCVKGMKMKFNFRFIA